MTIIFFSVPRPVKTLYVARDLFTGTQPAPLPSPRQGAVNRQTRVSSSNQWTITDAEIAISIALGRLRGCVQATSPVWGECQVVGPAMSRVAGRAFSVLIQPEDPASDLACGFYPTAAPTADPRTAGHGWAYQAGNLAAIAPGQTPLLDNSSRGSRPLEYLAVTILQAKGAYVLLSTVHGDAGLGYGMVDPIGVPAYPLARLLWVDSGSLAAADATVYPYLSFYDTIDPTNVDALHHAVEEVLVRDLAGTTLTTQDGLATYSDTVTRADSTTTLGTTDSGQAWTAVVGTWGVSSNKAYVQTSGGFNLAKFSAMADGIFQWDVTVGASATQFWATILRFQDASNYIQMTNNSSSTGWLLQKVVAGVASTITSGVTTWAINTTYRVTVLAYGNRYQVLINGASGTGGAWATDGTNSFLTAVGMGIRAASAGANVARFFNLAAFPHTLTLPSGLVDTRVFRQWTDGATIAADTFTGADSTDLSGRALDTGGVSWVTTAGTAVITSNKARFTSGTANVGILSHASSVNDASVSADILTRSDLNLTTGAVRAGIVGRLTDASNYVFVRLFMDQSQTNSDEIEIGMVSAGTGHVYHKVNIADFYAAATTYTLKVQFLGDRMRVFLNGTHLQTWIPLVAQAGTRWGVARWLDQDFAATAGDLGSVIDSYTLKAVA